MTEKNIKIVGYDAQGPETEDNLASISFRDPENADGCFCVGFRFNGGSLDNPTNWQYDHTNYWTGETIVDDSIHEAPVTKEKIIEVLDKQGETLDSLLRRFLELLK